MSFTSLLARLKWDYDKRCKYDLFIEPSLVYRDIDYDTLKMLINACKESGIKYTVIKYQSKQEIKS
jgi:hypothetical protein